MRYTIQHLTQFKYDRPVRESVTELRMQPRSEGNQYCHNFEVTIKPLATVSWYRDFMFNTIHHFDIPALYDELFLKAEATVEVQPSPVLERSLPSISWNDLDQSLDGNHWDYLHPSHFARPTAELQALSDALQLSRHSDPLSVLYRLNKSIYEEFDYVAHSTRVESPIDDALTARRGVCQDFTHIMIALGRSIGIPCRYVSGYLYHKDDEDRSAEDATHAWMEAWLPGPGWIGFDPTNNLVASDRHIRVAIGRDYADVPPTRGTYKGDAVERLSVGVRVSRANQRVVDEEIQLNVTTISRPREEDEERQAALAAQQQQQ